MKKLNTVIILLLITALILTGCGSKSPESVTIASLKGPTGMGMAKLMSDHNAEDDSYDFILSSAPDELTGKIISGEIDIACVPTNLASVLYNKTEGKVKLAAVNTLGVLYILENGNTINSMADLKGKTIYASGQGSSPDYVLRYLLQENGIDPENDVTIDFSLTHADLAAAIASGKADIALLPEPFVTTVLAKNENTRIAINANDEWQDASGLDLSMGCIVVQTEFAENYPDALNAFLDEYKTSVDFANNRIDEASVLIENLGIIPKAALAKKAIPNCNIVYVDAKDAQDDLTNVYQILFDFNPKSVGGKLPNDDFYYNKK